MIGYLKGVVQTKLNDSIILLTGGVGYLVSVTLTNLSSLNNNQDLDLYVFTNVKDDAIELYGFKTIEELSLFKSVLGVSGIGPKTAMLVINRGVEGVRTALVKADVDFFTNIPRLGQKNAQRMIIELKQKIGAITDLDLSQTSVETQEVVEALQSMGYSKAEAIKALKGLPSGEYTVEQKITQALRQIGKVKLKI